MRPLTTDQKVGSSNLSGRTFASKAPTALRCRGFRLSRRGWDRSGIDWPGGIEVGPVRRPQVLAHLPARLGDSEPRKVSVGEAA